MSLADTVVPLRRPPAIRVRRTLRISRADLARHLNRSLG